MKRQLLATSICSALLLAGCGGDSTPASSDNAKATPSVDFSIVAIDGYLQHAMVCQDQNNNQTCENDELLGYTDEKGQLSGKITSTQSPFIVKTIVGKTIDSDLPEQTVEQSITMMGLPDEKAITPFTDLAYNLAKSAAGNGDVTDVLISQARQDVEEMMTSALQRESDQNYDTSLIWGDYVEKRHSSSNSAEQDILAQTHFAAKLILEIDSSATLTTAEDIVQELPKHQAAISQVDNKKPIPEPEWKDNGTISTNYPPMVDILTVTKLEKEIAIDDFYVGQENAGHSLTVFDGQNDLFSDNDELINIKQIHFLVDGKQTDKTVIAGLTAQLVKTDQPSNAYISIYGSATTAGQYIIPVIYTDSFGAKAKAEIRFTVYDTVENKAPTVITDAKKRIESDILKATWKQGVNVSLNMSGLFSDPESEPLAISLQTAPTGMRLDSKAMTVFGAPQEAGKSNIVLLASDGKNTVQASFSLPTIENSPIEAADLAKKLEAQPLYTLDQQSPKPSTYKLACSRLTFKNGEILESTFSKNCTEIQGENSLVGTYNTANNELTIAFSEDGYSAKLSELKQDTIQDVIMVIDDPTNLTPNKSKSVLRLYTSPEAAQSALNQPAGQYYIANSFTQIDGYVSRQWNTQSGDELALNFTASINATCAALGFEQTSYDSSKWMIRDVMSFASAVDGADFGSVTSSLAQEVNGVCQLNGAFVNSGTIKYMPLAKLAPLSPSHMILTSKNSGMESIPMRVLIGDSVGLTQPKVTPLDSGTYYVVTDQNYTPDKKSITPTELHKISQQFGGGVWEDSIWINDTWVTVPETLAVTYSKLKDSDNNPSSAILAFSTPDKWVHTNTFTGDNLLYTFGDPKIEAGAVLSSPETKMGRINLSESRALTYYTALNDALSLTEKDVLDKSFTGVTFKRESTSLDRLIPVTEVSAMTADFLDNEEVMVNGQKWQFITEIDNSLVFANATATLFLFEDATTANKVACLIGRGCTKGDPLVEHFPVFNIENGENSHLALTTDMVYFSPANWATSTGTDKVVWNVNQQSGSSYTAEFTLNNSPSSEPVCNVQFKHYGSLLSNTKVVSPECQKTAYNQAESTYVLLKDTNTGIALGRIQPQADQQSKYKADFVLMLFDQAKESVLVDQIEQRWKKAEAIVPAE